MRLFFLYRELYLLVYDFVDGRMEFICRMAKYIMPEKKHIEFDKNNYESKGIDFKDLISKIRMKG